LAQHGAEEQQLLTNLKERMTSYSPKLVKVHTVPALSREPTNPRSKTRTKYLKELCKQLIAATNHQVLGSLRSQEGGNEELEGLFSELAHHMALGRERGKAFCGRRDLLDSICQSISQNDNRTHPPLIIHGMPGSGKATLLCQLCERVPAVLGQETVVALRLLGTSQLSSTPHNLLRNICLQVCPALGLPSPGAQVAKGNDGTSVLFFHNLLLSVSRSSTRSLVLILGSVEQLDYLDGAHRLHWLPKSCPPKVHIIVSTLAAANHGPLQTLREAIPEPEAYFEVEPLSSEQVVEMLTMLMVLARRRLTPAQQDLFQHSFPEGGHPLLLELAFNEAKRWASYTLPSELAIATTVSEAMHSLCERLEKLHGPLLVSHTLGYLACSRNGLSEAELKDILSLDDGVLSEIYQHQPPPSKSILRLPPLVWAQLRRDIGECLQERRADSFVLLTLAHRQFAAVVQGRYLSGPESTKRHLLLADFFRGTWSWGMKKPAVLPTLSKPLNADRKVAPQPLWFSDTVTNKRKLNELPFHLLSSGQMEALKQDVLGNMSWFTCRILATGAASLADDFTLCIKHTSCPEMRLVRDTLLLLKPTIDSLQGGASVIYTEVLARLHSFVPSYPDLIGLLCQQCVSWFSACPHPVLIPLCGFLQPPAGPLRTTLTGFLKGVTVLELCADRMVLVGGSQDGSLMVWNMKDIEVMHFLTGHSAEVRCVRMFGKGTRAVSAAMDGTLCLWNLNSGREEFSIKDAHSGEQHLCQLHVDEKNRIVYSTSGSKVNAWHLDTAALAFQISGDVWLCTAVFVPRMVVMTVSEGGGLSLWDSSTGELRFKHQLSGLQEEAPMCSVLLQKQGRMVVGFSRGSLSMVLLEKLPMEVHFVVLSEDETLLAAGFGQHVRVFLAGSKGFHRFLAADLEHQGLVQAAAISSDNTTIVTGCQSEAIWVWSLSEQGLLTDTLGGTETPVTLLALCGSMLVSASPSAPCLQVWDLTYNCTHKTVPPSVACIDRPALSHNGNYIYFPQAGNSHKIIIWDSVGGVESDTLDASAPVRCLEVAEERRLLFAGLASGALLVFPLDSQQQDVVCIPPPESRKPINHMALSRQEEQLAVAYSDLVLVLDLSPGEPCPVLDGPVYTFYTQLPAAVISSVALLAQYRVLYGMTSGELFLYDCPQAKVSPLEAHRSKVTCLETSHRERWALSGSEDSQQCLWDLELCHGKLQYGADNHRTT
uniref:NACHT and WD repeat domain containing 1 n=1 Tax=Sphenodon punctatus TaxID=8508 RepID=A0A8D0L6V3_SPHPU